MKKVFWVLITCLLVVMVNVPRLVQQKPLPAFLESDFVFPEMGCSVLYAADENVVLGGNNEDFINPFTRVWFLPPEENAYGRVYFGYDGFLWQGGVNDHGLFTDALAMEEGITVDQGDKPLYPGTLSDKALAECDRVACVIDLFSTYHTNDVWRFSFLFGDAYGDSVIIEPNGFLLKEGAYQVATNFYQTTTDSYHCEHEACGRFRTASQIFETAPKFSVEVMREALAAVHFEGSSPTLYSNIYDLKNNLIYLYYFYDYETEVVIDIAAELAQGPHSYALADLFPGNTAAQNWSKKMAADVKSRQDAYPTFPDNPAVYESLSGEYQLTPPGAFYDTLWVAVENKELVLKIKPDKAWLDLTAFEPDSFHHVSMFYDFTLHFLFGPDGQAQQFVYTQDGENFTYVRTGMDVIQATEIPIPTATLPATTELSPLIATPTDLSPTNTVPAEPSTNPQPAAERSGFWLVIPGVILFGVVVWILRKQK
ncbi:MAG: hypothetical protein CL609_07775 [Anaerolineaceae bacterium]|nr:hypothetical protein [Anaerolineaceae bacterium]